FMSAARLALIFLFFFSSTRRHTSFSRDWSSDVCSSDLARPFYGAYKSAISDSWHGKFRDNKKSVAVGGNKAGAGHRSDRIYWCFAAQGPAFRRLAGNRPGA